VDRRLGLRDVDVAALAGPRAAVERREQDDQREPRRNVVAVRTVRPERRPVGPADERLESRHRSADVPVPGEAAVRTGLPMSDVLSMITLALSSRSRS
jgi:hypothetical protein